MNFNENQKEECADEFEYELSNNQTLCILKTDKGFQICIATRGVQGPEETPHIINVSSLEAAGNFIGKVNQLLFPNRPKRQNYEIELSATQSIESYI